MTPMIPEHRNLGQSFIKKGTDRSKEYQVQYLLQNHMLESFWVSSESHVSVDQVEPLEIYQPKWKYCAEFSSYGAAVCTELDAKRVQNLKDHPLYYFLGYTQFVCQLEPGMLYYRQLLFDIKQFVWL